MPDSPQSRYRARQRARNLCQDCAKPKGYARRDKGLCVRCQHRDTLRKRERVTLRRVFRCANCGGVIPYRLGTHRAHYCPTCAPEMRRTHSLRWQVAHPARYAVTHLAAAKAYQARQKQAGRCVVCGKPVTKRRSGGPTNGKPTQFCRRHLVAKRAVYWRKKIAA